MLRETVILGELTGANHQIVEWRNPVSDMTNPETDSEMKEQEEERKLHRMAKVYDVLNIWQGRQNLQATQNESRTHCKQLTGIGHNSETEVIINASWSLFQHDGALHLNRQRN